MVTIADTILGDNGEIIRLVAAGSSPGTTLYLNFNYETPGANGYSSNPRMRLVPTVYKLLDYTIGGECGRPRRGRPDPG